MSRSPESHLPTGSVAAPRVEAGMKGHLCSLLPLSPFQAMAAPTGAGSGRGRNRGWGAAGARVAVILRSGAADIQGCGLEARLPLDKEPPPDG